MTMTARDTRHTQLNRTLGAWPYFAPDEVQAVTQVLESGKVNYWTGLEGREFEREYAEYLNVPYTIALHNGTVALELALLAYGIGNGDEVITTPRTFIASASAAVMRGAVPVLADVDRESQNITAETIRPLITERTRAIIAVHLAGWPCDMDPILELAREYNLVVIEDCAQAHGAFYKGRPVGSMGHAGAFSFCQDKIMTTGGEGGILSLRDEAVWRRAWAFKDHGKSFEAVYEREHPPGYRWLHESFGTNWRMLEVQAAIGRIQLRKLPAWIEQRRRNAGVYDHRLGCFACLRLPQPSSNVLHSYYKYYAFVRPEKLAPGWTRDRILAEVSARGVPIFTGSCPEIYLEKAFVNVGYGPSEPLEVARELGETSLMFLLHPTLLEADIEAMCDVLTEVLGLCCLKEGRVD